MKKQQKIIIICLAAVIIAASVIVFIAGRKDDPPKLTVSNELGIEISATTTTVLFLNLIKSRIQWPWPSIRKAPRTLRTTAG